jgi:hypothetical protein
MVWYPYPFVNVSDVGNVGVLGRSETPFVVFAFSGAALLWVVNRRATNA